MTWDPTAFNHDLAAAVESYNGPEAARLCDELLDHLRSTDQAYPARDAMRVLRQLRRKRFFRTMAVVAEGLLQSGQQAPFVRCEYAQALIELGMPSAAEPLLNEVLRSAANPQELLEAQGLLGRAAKQMLVTFGETSGPHRTTQFVDAITPYAGAYENDPAGCAWHGINAAALVMRAEREGIRIGGFPDPAIVATEVLAAAEAHLEDPYRPADPWDAALAAEACLVLGRHDGAVLWTQRYTADPQADAFELASTLRQFTEVWQLDSASEPGRRILPMLRAQMLQRSEGVRLELAPADVAADSAMPDSAFEKVLGGTGLVTHSWYQRGMRRSRAVAHIAHSSGRPVGTGFLVERGDLIGNDDTTAVLVTNSHVIADDPSADDTLTPDQAVITFQVLAADGGGAPTFHPHRVLWSSPPRQLDTTVIALAEPVASLEPCDVTKARPRLDGKQRVYVIGHPQGRELSYSIDDNVLLDYDDRVLHYRAPTEPGSSGSPVFNRDWDVIGIHHAGRSDMPRLKGQDGTYPANEGIWIGAVRRAMARTT